MRDSLDRPACRDHVPHGWGAHRAQGWPPAGAGAGPGGVPGPCCSPAPGPPLILPAADPRTPPADPHWASVSSPTDTSPLPPARGQPKPALSRALPLSLGASALAPGLRLQHICDTQGQCGLNGAQCGVLTIPSAPALAPLCPGDLMGLGCPRTWGGLRGRMCHRNRRAPPAQPGSVLKQMLENTYGENGGRHGCPSGACPGSPNPNPQRASWCLANPTTGKEGPPRAHKGLPARPYLGALSPSTSPCHVGRPPMWCGGHSDSPAAPSDGPGVLGLGIQAHWPLPPMASSLRGDQPAPAEDEWGPDTPQGGRGGLTQG